MNLKYCCSACEVLDGNFSAPSVKIMDSFSHLDQVNFKSKYQLDSQPFDYELYVEGTHCSSCIHLIEDIPDFDDSVIEARVNFSQSRLLLKVTPKFSLAKLAHLLVSWGYKPHFLEKDSNSSELVHIENRNLLKNLAIAGACAGNIMLFVIPVYSGLNGSLATAFNWMSFVLFLPILLYSGVPFYKGAWNSLRYKTVNVDLPITIAMVSGFLLSTINLVRGSGAIYYDSTASFIFLILCARYFLKRTQQKFVSAIQYQDFFGNQRERHFAFNVDTNLSRRCHSP
jgi:Cu+-exporting ATPase